jgi:hypothetical protein
MKEIKETEREEGKAIGLPIKRKNDIEIEKKLMSRKNRRKRRNANGPTETGKKGYEVK